MLWNILCFIIFNVEHYTRSTLFWSHLEKWLNIHGIKLLCLETLYISLFPLLRIRCQTHWYAGILQIRALWVALRGKNLILLYGSIFFQEEKINIYIAGYPLWFFYISDVQFRQKSIPIQFRFRTKALQFNSDSNSTLEYVSSIQFQFQFHPGKYELNSIPIPIPRNLDSNSDSVSTHKNHTSMMSTPFPIIRISLNIWIQVVWIWIWIQIWPIPDYIVI